MILDEPKYALYSTWDKLKVMDRKGKTVFSCNNLYYLETDKEKEQKYLEYYKENNNELYSILLVILDKKMSRVKTKGNHLDIDTNLGKIRIDLMSKDIIDNYDSLLEKTGSIYNKNRDDFIKFYKIMSKDYYFKHNNYENNHYRDNAGGLHFNLSNRSNLLKIDNDDFVVSFIKDMIDNTDKYVETNYLMETILEKDRKKSRLCCRGTNININSLDFDINIDYLEDYVVEKISNMIKDHNEKIDDNKKILVKEF